MESFVYIAVAVVVLYFVIKWVWNFCIDWFGSGN